MAGRLLFLGNIGLSEWIIILVVVLILFGGTRIPKLAKDLGSGIREFRKSLAGQPDEITDERHEEQRSLPKAPAKKGRKKASS